MSSIRPISGLEAFDSGVNISKNQIWVAVPGTIRSFDPDTVTCVVDMAIISGINTSKEDNISFDRLDRDSEDYPFLMDAPVVFSARRRLHAYFPDQSR